MNRSPKELLKQYAAGKISADEINPSSRQEWASYYYELCSVLELDWLIRTFEERGELEQWPEAERSFYISLMAELPERSDASTVFSSRFFLDNAAGELTVIRYKEPDRKPKYQLSVDSNNGSAPIVACFDLGAMGPGVDYGNLTSDELREVARSMKQNS